MNNTLLLTIIGILTFLLMLGMWNRAYFALTPHDQRLNMNLGRMLIILSVLLLGTFYYWEKKLGVDLEMERFSEGFGYLEHVAMLCASVLAATVVYHIFLWCVPRLVIYINDKLSPNY